MCNLTRELYVVYSCTQNLKCLIVPRTIIRDVLYLIVTRIIVVTGEIMDCVCRWVGLSNGRIERTPFWCGCSNAPAQRINLCLDVARASSDIPEFAIVQSFQCASYIELHIGWCDGKQRFRMGGVSSDLIQNCAELWTVVYEVVRDWVDIEIRC